MINTRVIEQTQWNEFFNASESPSFLEAWEWGDLQEQLGYKVERVGTYDDNKCISIAQIIGIKAKRGSFLFIPHGPIFAPSSDLEMKYTILENLTAYLKEKAVKESYDFIRISPILEDTSENRDLFIRTGYREASLYMHAEHVWMLQLRNTEEELLQEMRKTTRYLIKKAPKDNVIIEKRTDDEAIDIFMQLYAHTAEREHFTPFSREYIKNELHSFLKTTNALFLFGKVANEYLAGALVIFTQSTGFYHQGASIHTKFPVPYLLQWEAICESKKRGCLFYSFWGIAPDESPEHPWAGLTQFKKGFNGFQINYAPTVDYPVSAKYWITWGYEKLLRWRRGV